MKKKEKNNIIIIKSIKLKMNSDLSINIINKQDSYKS